MNTLDNYLKLQPDGQIETKPLQRIASAQADLLKEIINKTAVASLPTPHFYSSTAFESEFYRLCSIL